MKRVTAAEACVIPQLDTEVTSAKIDDKHENVFAVVLQAVKCFVKVKQNACTAFLRSLERDVEWSGRVVMRGGGPILKDTAAGE